MSKLVGTWDLESSENFDEYMKAIGVGLVQRKMAATLKPTVILSNDGDKWSMGLRTKVRNNDISWVDGVEFDEVTLDGRKSKTLIKLEGEDKLVQVQKDGDTIITTITREIVNDKLVQVITTIIIIN
jgi:hypothetical protein